MPADRACCGARRPNGTASTIVSAAGRTITVRDGANWLAFTAAIGSWQKLTLLANNTIQTLERGARSDQKPFTSPRMPLLMMRPNALVDGLGATTVVA